MADKFFIARGDVVGSHVLPSCWGPFQDMEAALDAAAKIPMSGAYTVFGGAALHVVTVTINAPTVSSAPIS